MVFINDTTRKSWACEMNIGSEKTQDFTVGFGLPKVNMCFPGFKKKALTFSYDDGIREDRQLICILNKYGMKSTFNLGNLFMYEHDPEIYLTAAECVALYRDTGYEVAAHGERHLRLTELEAPAVWREIMHCKQTLEKLFGYIVSGMAYAFGDCNDEVIQILRSCGIHYARTTVSTEDFALPHDWLRMPCTCHHGNTRLWMKV